jgi:hypothetical protein
MSVTRNVARDVDARMDGYAYLDRLQADDFARLRGYAADGRARFSTVYRRGPAPVLTYRRAAVREARTPGTCGPPPAA